MTKVRFQMVHQFFKNTSALAAARSSNENNHPNILAQLATMKEQTVQMQKGCSRQGFPESVSSCCIQKRPQLDRESGSLQGSSRNSTMRGEMDSSCSLCARTLSSPSSEHLAMLVAFALLGGSQQRSSRQGSGTVCCLCNCRPASFTTRGPDSEA